jgi:outer membrane protein TolC
MRKKYLILGCSVLLAVIIGNNQITAQENTVLGISQMITLAVSNNLQLKKANYNLKNTELEARKLEAENLLGKSTISDLQKEIVLLNQQNQFQSEKDQLLIRVADDYFRIKISEKDIESKQKKVELERLILEDVEKQVAAGYSVDLDLLQQGNEYYNALFSYQGSELNYQQLLIEVKNRLGLDRNENIITSELTIAEFPEMPLAESIAKARQNSISLQSHTVNIKKVERELEVARADDLSEIEILKLENNLGIAKLDKSLAEQELNYQVETQWMNYNQAKNDIISSQRSLRQMEENQSIIQRQVQAGLRSEEEGLSAAIGVLDSQHRLISSIRQVYQSYLELQRMMGTLDEGDIK